ncbi:22348_t:CDS:2 [Gigaspora rosea]|nr:22348_t:CDS:2 [Gigaspora rosea]
MFFIFLSKGDLESVHRKIVQQVELQAREIRATISSQQFLELSPVNNDRTNLQPLLQSFSDMYQVWSPHQQIAIQSQLEELVNTPPVALQDPVTSKPRGRPVGARNKRTTQRDPSAFEHIEKRSRQCGTCHQAGHNSRTCPNV